MKPIRVRVKRNITAANLLGECGSRKVVIPKGTVGTLVAMEFNGLCCVQFTQKLYGQWLTSRELEVVIPEGACPDCNARFVATED